MELVHCTITGPCLRMHYRPLVRTLQHVTVPIWNIYQGDGRIATRAGKNLGFKEFFLGF